MHRRVPGLHQDLLTLASLDRWCHYLHHHLHRKVPGLHHVEVVPQLVVPTACPGGHHGTRPVSPLQHRPHNNMYKVRLQASVLSQFRLTLMKAGQAFVARGRTKKGICGTELDKACMQQEGPQQLRLQLLCLDQMPSVLVALVEWSKKVPTRWSLLY